MTTDALYDEHWLLAYEANYRGWLPSVCGDHVALSLNAFELVHHFSPSCKLPRIDFARSVWIQPEDVGMVSFLS
jgi:hypothetical protein